MDYDIEESELEATVRRYHFAWVCRSLLMVTGHPIMSDAITSFARANNCDEILIDLLKEVDLQGDANGF